MPDKFAVSVTGAGSQTVVPAPVQAGGLTTAFIRVLSYHLSASATSTVTHESSVSSTVLCTDYLGTASPVSELDADGGVYDVPPGEGLVIASTGGNVGGCGRYTVIQGVRVNRAITLPNTPQNLTIPVISGTTTVSQVLTTTNGTWNNSPTGYAYQWYSNGVPVGTNANTYTLVSADTGNFITVVVTASNANGSGTATSAAVGPVAAVASPSAPAVRGRTTAAAGAAGATTTTHAPTARARAAPAAAVGGALTSPRAGASRSRSQSAAASVGAAAVPHAAGARSRSGHAVGSATTGPIVGTAGTVVAGTSFVVNLPTNSVNDHLNMVIANYASGSGGNILFTPSGWTNKANSSDTSGDLVMQTYTLVSPGGLTSVTLTTNLIANMPWNAIAKNESTAAYVKSTSNQNGALGTTLTTSPQTGPSGTYTIEDYFAAVPLNQTMAPTGGTVFSNGAMALAYRTETTPSGGTGSAIVVGSPTSWVTESVIVQ